MHAASTNPFDQGAPPAAGVDPQIVNNIVPINCRGNAKGQHSKIIERNPGSSANTYLEKYIANIAAGETHFPEDSVKFGISGNDQGCDHD